MSATSNDDQAKRQKIEYRRPATSSNPNFVPRKAWPEERYTITRPAAFSGRRWQRKSNGEIADDAAAAAYAQPLQILNPMGGGPEEGEVLGSGSPQLPAQRMRLSDLYAQATGLSSGAQQAAGGRGGSSLRSNSRGQPTAPTHGSGRNKVWTRHVQPAPAQAEEPFSAAVAAPTSIPRASHAAAADVNVSGGGGGGNAAFREGYDAAGRTLNASRAGSYIEAQHHAAIVAAMQPEARRTAAQDGYRARIEEEMEATTDPAVKAELRGYRKIAFLQQQAAGAWRDGDRGSNRKQPGVPEKRPRSETPNQDSDGGGGQTRFRKGPRNVMVAAEGKEQQRRTGNGSIGGGSGRPGSGKRPVSLMHTTSSAKSNKWEASGTGKATKWESNKKSKMAVAANGSGRAAPNKQASQAQSAPKPVSLDQKLNMSLDALSGKGLASTQPRKKAAPTAKAVSGGSASSAGKHQPITWQPQ